MSKAFDVAVIGGGVGGAACALRLARAGATVVLFERETGPHHKVCGEFLSVEGLSELAAAGIDLDSLGAARISRFRLHGPRVSAECALPGLCRGFSRSELDARLLARAREAGAVIVRGLTIRSHGWNGDTFAVESGAERWVSRDLVCATGKFEFPGFPKREGRDEGLIGFKTHLRLSPRARRELEGHVELFVFPGGYAGLCMIEGGKANLCFLLDRALTKEMPRRSAELCASLGGQHRELGRRLAGASASFDRPVTIGRVPYGFVRRHAAGPRVYSIGDQAAVIPSLTGDGMTIALLTARESARFLIEARGRDLSADYHRELTRFASPQVAFGYRLHQAFRRPGWMDAAATVMKLAPQAVDWAFKKTRVPSWVAHQSSDGLEQFTRNGRWRPVNTP